MDLNKIRELEGVVDFSPPARIIEGMEKDPCAFAERVSFMSDQVYSCNYKRKCDNQIQYGTTQNYCKRQMR